jgi:hypothetical protein
MKNLLLTTLPHSKAKIRLKNSYACSSVRTEYELIFGPRGPFCNDQGYDTKAYTNHPRMRRMLLVDCDCEPDSCWKSISSVSM